MPAHLEAFVSATVALFGLIWGSYLNVVVYRLPRGLSTAVPASHCPRCSSRIRPLQNVPVLSWIALGARCRYCRGAISPRYPLVEMATAGIFVLGFHRFDRPLEVFVSWLLGWTLLALALIDLDRRLVPLALTLPLGVAAWMAQPFLRWAGPWNAVATSLGAFALVAWVAQVWTSLRGLRHADKNGLDTGLGFGDACALFLLGAFFGLEATLRILVWATLAATLVWVAGRSWSFVLSRFGRHGLARGRLPQGRLPQGRLPLVTFLALAALWLLLLDPRGVSGP